VAVGASAVGAHNCRYELGLDAPIARTERHRQEVPLREGGDVVLSGRRLKDVPGSTPAGRNRQFRAVSMAVSVPALRRFLGVDWTERGVTRCVDALAFCLE
jgi:hypothetical protein